MIKSMSKVNPIQTKAILQNPVVRACVQGEVETNERHSTEGVKSWKCSRKRFFGRKCCLIENK